MVSCYDAFFTAKLAEADRLLSRREYEVDRTPTENGALVRFDSNDYFSLRRHPEVARAAAEAVYAYGTGAGASRAAGGDLPIYARLERALAAKYGYEACLLVGSGYLANTGVISALAGKGDLIFADKLAHASMLDGARLSGAELIRFRHNDPDHLEKLLAQKRADGLKCLILYETVYGMDGDAAPGAALAALARRYEALTVADHAHGAGFVRPGAEEADILIGTLSKAYASYGGYVCCSAAARAYFIGACRPALFSTALPPAAVAAALEALRMLEAEPERVARARANALRFSEALRLPASAGAVVPVKLGGNEEALRAGEALRACGIRAGVIRPPSVPPGTARLRFAFGAEHDERDVRLLVEIVRLIRKEGE